MLFIIKLILISLIAYLLIKQVIKYAHQIHLLDIPNERSHHCNIIPSGAGIGFVLAFLIGIVVFELQLLFGYWFLFLAIFMVFAMGVYDDRHDVSPKLKFIAIFLAVILMFVNGIGIDTLGTWFGYELTLVWWIALPFTMFAIAGFTNALNLIDGIDGLSASTSIVILLFFALIGLEYKDHTIVILSTFTTASIIGFLFLNWNPAKIFMGDSGSLTLGFIIAVLAMLSIQHIHPITILYLAALPVLDTLIVMIRRIRRGKSPFRPDKTHIHHIMVKFFEMNVRKTVIFLVILQMVFSGVGYLLIDTIKNNTSISVESFALIGFVLMFLMFYMIFTGIKKRQKALDNKLQDKKFSDEYTI